MNAFIKAMNNSKMMNNSKTVYHLPTSLIAGFGSVISIILIIAFIGLYRSHTVQTELELVVSHYNQQIQLVRQMRVAARERITMLYAATNTDDDFSRDDYIQNFWDYGEEFLKARSNLLDMALSTKDRELLEQHREMAKSFAPPQRQVIAMLDEGKTEEARYFLLNNVEPNQAVALELLDGYLDRLHQLSEDTLTFVNEQTQNSVYMLSFMAIIGTLISILIAIVVSKRMYHLLSAEYMAKQQAELANEGKTNFLANISHELRTPMNAILGFNQILLTSGLSSSQAKQMNKLADSSTNLNNIINGLLDFTLLESNSLKVEKVPFCLSDIVRKINQTYRQKAETKSLSLIIETNNHVPNYFIGDPVKIEKVLHHLIDNAIKFTDLGEVKFVIEFDNQQSAQTIIQLKFVIQDTGIGIDENAASHLFQSFQQIDGSSTRKHGGLGMGLIIAKKMVEALGGEIDYKSTPFQGSSFWFIIPLTINSELSDDYLQLDFLEEKMEEDLKDSAASNSNTREYDQKKVDELFILLNKLLADDDSDAHEVIDELLEYYQGRSKPELDVLEKIAQLISEYEFEEALKLLSQFNTEH